MVQRYDEEFKREVVRVARTSGLTQKRVAEDFGIGFSTLGKWLSQFSGQLGVTDADFDAHDELKRLRKENKILKEEREVLKRQPYSSRAKNHEICIH